VLLNVRVKKQYDMCALEGAANRHLARLKDELDQIESYLMVPDQFTVHAGMPECLVWLPTSFFH
jgi:hypothetical protein